MDRNKLRYKQKLQERKSHVYVINRNANKVTPLAATNRRNAIQITNDQTLSSIVEEFLKETTIPGLNHLSGGNSRIAKLLWISLFFTGIAMAIYQSRSLITDYQKYAVVERSFREMQWAVPFPSATVCVNIPNRWYNVTEEPGRSFLEHIARLFEESAAELSEKLPLADVLGTHEHVMLNKLASLSEYERTKLGIPLDLFVISCTWGDDDCMESLFPFNNLYYGNCFTFNPGFDHNRGLMSDKSKSLSILLRYDFADAFPYLRRDEGTILLIHPSGSAPVLQERQLFTLYPGRWLKLGTSMTTFNRLKEPYSSKCVDIDEPDMVTKSLYYRSDRPYNYTLDACTVSCTQNLSARLCSCIQAPFAFPTYPFDTVCRNACPHLSEVGEAEVCECRRPCSDTMYDLRVDVDDRWVNQEVWKEWVKDCLTNYSGTDVNITRLSGFELYTASTLLETINEEPKITWADFLGSIGGNFGLWVGVSVISMVEIFELFSKLTVAVIRRISGFRAS